MERSEVRLLPFVRWQQARVLILDEPTNHLDIRYQLEVLDLVRGARVTTLMSIHDVNLAAGYSIHQPNRSTEGPREGDGRSKGDSFLSRFLFRLNHQGIRNRTLGRFPLIGPGVLVSLRRGPLVHRWFLFRLNHRGIRRRTLGGFALRDMRTLRPFPDGGIHPIIAFNRPFLNGLSSRRALLRTSLFSSSGGEGTSSTF